MFRGTYRVRIDPKGRIAIPASFRPQLPEGSAISVGPDQVLTIYPLDRYEEMTRALEAPIVGATEDQRKRSRLFHSFAAPVEFDQQGRVTLSPAQRALARLEPGSTAVVIGSGQVVEIWSADRWDSYSGDALENFTELVSS